MEEYKNLNFYFRSKSVKIKDKTWKLIIQLLIWILKYSYLQNWAWTWKFIILVSYLFTNLFLTWNKWSWFPSLSIEQGIFLFSHILIIFYFNLESSNYNPCNYTKQTNWHWHGWLGSQLDDLQQNVLYSCDFASSDLFSFWPLLKYLHIFINIVVKHNYWSSDLLQEVIWHVY